MKEKVSLYYNQITIGSQSVTISDVIVYILEAPSTSSSQKKKNWRNKVKEKERMKRRRKKGRRWKRGEEEKGMERVFSEGKRKGKMRGGRKDEEEGEGE